MSKIKQSGTWGDWINQPEGEQEHVIETARGAISRKDIPPAPPVKYEGSEIKVRVQSDMSVLMSAPALILEQEMDRLSRKALDGPLSDKEISRFRQLVDSLVSLSREKRALDAKSKFDTMTDAELEIELRKYTEKL